MGSAPFLLKNFGGGRGPLGPLLRAPPILPSFIFLRITYFFQKWGDIIYSCEANIVVRDHTSAVTEIISTHSTLKQIIESWNRCSKANLRNLPNCRFEREHICLTAATANNTKKWTLNQDCER